jgi:hypothetical protein
VQGWLGVQGNTCIPTSQWGSIGISMELQCSGVLDGDDSMQHETATSDCCATNVQMLHPLVAGNCRVTLLTMVSSDAASFLDTTNTLRLASRAQSISTSIVHNHMLFGELQLLPISQVLPADVCCPSLHAWLLLLRTCTVAPRLRRAGAGGRQAGGARPQELSPE